MALPLRSPYPPMEALSVEKIPEGAGWLYEPKWDGFRCLVFRDGDSVELQPKAGQPLARYFPELAAAVRSLTPPRFVLDGEIVIPVADTLSFDRAGAPARHERSEGAGRALRGRTNSARALRAGRAGSGPFS
jgi:ATP-dependent DNA ligase